MKMISDKQLHRLILYKKVLDSLKNEKVEYVFSHKLASMTGRSPALVRRDIMATGYSGSPAKGYNVTELLGELKSYIDPQDIQKVCIAGIGNLGRALIDHINSRDSRLEIMAGFDKDPAKVGRVIHGIRSYSIDDLTEIVQEHNIEIALLTVPSNQAQIVAEQLVNSGIRAIINFTPARLILPDYIIIENIDLLMTIEKAAFFARQSNKEM